MTDAMLKEVGLKREKRIADDERWVNDRRAMMLKVTKQVIQKDPILYQFFSLVESANHHIANPKIDMETEDQLASHLVNKFCLPRGSKILKWSEAVESDCIVFLMQHKSFRFVPPEEQFPIFRGMDEINLAHGVAGSPGGHRPTIKKREAVFEI